MFRRTVRKLLWHLKKPQKQPLCFWGLMQEICARRKSARKGITHTIFPFAVVGSSLLHIGLGLLRLRLLHHLYLLWLWFAFNSLGLLRFQRCCPFIPSRTSYSRTMGLWLLWVICIVAVVHTVSLDVYHWMDVIWMNVIWMDVIWMDVIWRPSDYHARCCNAYHEYDIPLLWFYEFMDRYVMLGYGRIIQVA